MQKVLVTGASGFIGKNFITQEQKIIYTHCRGLDIIANVLGWFYGIS